MDFTIIPREITQLMCITSLKPTVKNVTEFKEKDSSIYVCHDGSGGWSTVCRGDEKKIKNKVMDDNAQSGHNIISRIITQPTC